MGLYRYSNDSAVSGSSSGCGSGGDSESSRTRCNSRSANALKDIIALLDDLNDRDLKILENLIDRLLCARE
ncbi:conserved protein of unknown function [Ruminococcaceae bacterium BL-6]|jgi:hypothetical protein|nr:conserved protein of unknown function [Ruminococcaceae bacterium BL-6]HBC26348.1 hypothetical protein [Oscillospiraceae bacterium]HBN81751.1 hypothetical protein [Oscillospiraceae bacterium]